MITLGRTRPLALALTALLAVPVTAKAQELKVETVAEGLEHPWGLAFLPDGRMLVTERGGRLRLVGTDGALSEPLTGLPEIFTQRQGGLLDIALDPAFAQNGRVYLTFSEPGGGGAGTAVLRAVLKGETLENTGVIFRQEPKVSGGNHFGSRLAFAPDGTLFVTTGDRFDHSNEAQELDNHLGKVLRITTDGAPAPGNPFLERAGARPEIWSYGHRNIQAAAIHPETGQLWTVEHGARGGDEVNTPEAGRNYGWPVISYGRHYSGAKIGEGTQKDGLEQPVYYWDPSIAPSGAVFYTGDLFPDWRGDLFVGALAGQLIARLEMQDGRITAEHRYLEDQGSRIRDVRQGPDGALYLLTDDGDDRILRITPAR